MTKKLNGTAKWIGIAIVILTNIAVIAYNTGVTHNHGKHLTKTVEKLEVKVDAIAEKINTINIKLAQK